MSTHQRPLILWLALLFLPLAMAAQEKLSGTVRDENREAIPSAVVKVYGKGEGKMLAYGLTNSEGVFGIEVKEGVGEGLRLTVSAFGYAQVERQVSSIGNVGEIVLMPSATELREATVKAPVVRNHGDTVTYSVDRLKTETDRTIEDVIKRIPGIEVKENGSIYYNEKPINKFYIEGADMLGGRYSLATKNINADDIATVNVYERHQPKRVLKDVVLSDRAALNINLKKHRMLKPVGNVLAGAGYCDEPLWRTEAFGLLIAPTRQYLMTAKANNAGVTYNREVEDHNSTQRYDALAKGILRPLSEAPSQIPAERAMTNRSAAATVNSLHKFSETTTLTTNAGYYYDRLGRKQDKQTIYRMVDGQEVIVDEVSRSRLGTQNGWLTLSLENNAERFYLSETLSAEGNWRNNRERVSDGRQITQYMKVDDYRVGNSLQAIWRKDNRVFNLNSYASVSNMPHGRLRATLPSMADSSIVDQQTEGLRFFTQESSSYKWVLSRLATLSVNASFEGCYDKLNSSYSVADASGSNQLTGYHLTTALYPSLQLTHGKLYGNADVLLQMEDLKSVNRITGSTTRYDKPRLGVRITANYVLSPRTRMQLGGEQSYTLGSLLDYADTPIYTTYRDSRVYGAEQLNVKDKLSANMNLTYRNTLNGVNAAVSGRYIYTRSNTLSGSDITQLATTHSTLNRKSSNTFWALDGHASRNIYEWHTILSMRGNATLTKADVMRHGLLLGMQNSMYGLEGKVESTLWNKHLVAALACRYTHARQYNNHEAAGRQNEWAPQLGLTILPTRQLELFATLSDQLQQSTSVADADSRYSQNLYLDMGGSYSFGRCELELTASNLTNRHTFSTLTFSSCDIVTYSWQMRPREYLATFRYSF